MPYDPACKLLFAHPRMAEDLLRGFVANGWSHALDFRTLELRPAASVSDDLRRREGDLLWRMSSGPGTPLRVTMRPAGASPVPMTAIRSPSVVFTPSGVGGPAGPARNAASGIAGGIAQASRSPLAASNR